MKFIIDNFTKPLKTCSEDRNLGLFHCVRSGSHRNRRNMSTVFNFFLCNVFILSFETQPCVYNVAVSPKEIPFALSSGHNKY